MALPIPTSAQQQLHCARQWSDRFKKVRPVGKVRGAKERTSFGKSKINVGYLSADFHTHATAFLIAELFERHNRDRFALFGYSYGRDDESPIRQRLMQGFDRFVDIRSMSDAQAAEQIAADEVDILIDLKGYTTDARTEILAARPAPLQVSFLGYPGTMGAAFIDYMIVDDFVAPAGHEPVFSEQLVRMPGSYQVNDSKREIAARTPTREECNLPPDHFVFCSFNNNYKITPPMFQAWMRLLKKVPNSVLWLVQSNAFSADNLRTEAEKAGVSGGRLIFAPLCPIAEHLARHRLADLFLDTFPVNAHTTASDALWAGCPIVTLAGDAFASRVAGSLLRTMGLPELITTSLVDYEALALRLAQDANLLGEYRTRIEANRKTSSLFDGGRFAQDLEKAFEVMWENYVAGRGPRGFQVR